MKITGYLHTRAPIHIADSSEGNATGIATLPVMDYGNEQGARIARIPGVKATVLRGMLRKAADDFVNEQMLRHGVRIPAEVFNALRHGSTAGRMNKDPITPALFDAMKGHPMMGLFGGGPRSGAGALSTAWMLPLCRETVRNDLVPTSDRYDGELPLGYTLIDRNGSMFPRIDMVHNPDAIEGGVVEDLDAKVDAMTGADMARRVKGGTEEGDSTERSSNLLTYSYMVPGVFLHLDVNVPRRTPDHVKGFLLVAMARAFTVNEIGGMQRIGFGRDVFNPTSVASLQMDGEPVFEVDGGEIAVVTTGEAGRLFAAFEAWHRDGRAWTAESLWEATGFTGIDLGEAAVKKGKAGKGGGKKAA